MAAWLARYQVGVAESGISRPDDIDAVRRAGINNFLIGESLVRADSPRLFLQSLINRTGKEYPAEGMDGTVSDGRN